MKKLLFIFTAIIFPVLFLNAQSDTECTIPPDKYCVLGDCINGKGQIEDKYGYSFTGTFKNGCRTGFGVEYLTEIDVEKSDGEMVVGVYITYKGQWKNDVKHGKGTEVRQAYKYFNNTIYNGKKTVLNGVWADGEFVVKPGKKK
jgi:hypothetical protein